MDGYHFDELTRRFAAGASRRALLKGMVGSLVAGLVGVSRQEADAQTRQPNGAPCTRATQCTALNCVDGVCCDTSCTGQCETCGTGTCTVVSGPPVGARPACPGSDPCTATCDGVTRTHCAAFPGGDTPCGDSTCANGWQTTYACGGDGTCHPTTTSCGLFVCNTDGSACLTTCASDADCVGAAHCAGGVCQGDKPPGEPCTGPDQCQHGHCVDGVCCLEGCGQCQVCNLPGNEGLCGPAADSGTCDGGICCDGKCVDISSDVRNCGACDHTCPPGECQAAVCVAGACDTAPHPFFDGRACDDGDPCTTGDHCENGTCVGTPVVCPVCEACSGGQCVADPTQEGDTCGDDGNACTNTVCRSGQCVSEPAVVCNVPGVCQTAPGSCNTQTGTCAYPNAPNNTNCGTNRICCGGTCCAAGQTCADGTCQAACLPLQATCDNNNQCCQDQSTICADLNDAGLCGLVGKTCCRLLAGSCAHDCDCCDFAAGATGCEGGRCCHHTEGLFCTSSGQCCGDTVCFSGRCCRFTGQSCGISAQCCSGQCCNGVCCNFGLVCVSGACQVP